MTLGVDVLRSLHPKGNLFVAHEEHMMAHVMCFIRNAGFDALACEADKPQLPKGIHRRCDVYQVRYTKDASTVCGRRKYGFKKCANLDEAVAFLHEQDAEAEDVPEGEDVPEAEHDPDDEHLPSEDAAEDNNAGDVANDM